ncbi:family 43 glycosylhydrolase [Hahella ganghwensis]|uniref:family 43 glycosylhydrolase n=1 Tax=Hahella ganghwensis TaxID=286420 RepID=UPI0003A8AEB8|nr:family 43 glycosylhydrolase [Hahella ganghwensis]
MFNISYGLWGRMMNSGKLAVMATVFLSLSMPCFAMAETFLNPVIEQRADPWIYKHADGFYYFTASVPEYNRIVIRRARSIEELANTHEHTVWWQPSTGPMSGFVWAPELHYIDGRWYLYYAASESDDLWDIRIYVLANSSPNPTDGTWVSKGELEVNDLGNPASFFALDATTFEHQGSRYLIWAQKPPSQESHLYIARMLNPWTIDRSTQALIAYPKYDWEKRGYNVNEGPAVLKRNGRIFVSYSASATDRNYAMGLLTVDENANLLISSSWRKSPVPVFESNARTHQYGPGHNSFTTSQNGKKDILIYHARDYAEIPGNSLYDPNRHMRAKVFTWNEDGTPNFGIPYANGLSGFSGLKLSFSQRCADVKGRSSAQGADLIQWDCRGEDHQTFLYESLGDKYAQLRASHSDLCLDVSERSLANGANVIQWPCHGGSNQQWIRELQGNNTFQLRNRHSGKCLDLYRWDNRNGASLRQWDCNGLDVQIWQED